MLDGIAQIRYDDVMRRKLIVWLQQNFNGKTTNLLTSVQLISLDTHLDLERFALELMAKFPIITSYLVFGKGKLKLYLKP